jgi:hypothetical protein
MKNLGGRLMNNLLDTVKAVLSTTTMRWLSLIESLPEDLLTRTPAPGEWSVMGCLSFLVLAPGVHFSRIMM